MSNQRSPFNWGFVFGILLCVGLNIYSLVANYEGGGCCMDCYGNFGFPIHFGDQLLFISGELRNWSGFIVDVGFALLCGIGIGFISQFVYSKLAPQD